MVRESEAILNHREYYLAFARESYEKERDISLAIGEPIANSQDKSDMRLGIKKIQSRRELEKGQIEGALNSDKNSFVATIPKDIGREQFLMRLGGTQIPTDREVLGHGYEEQMVEAVLYPSIFAEFPATFDAVAIAGTVDMVGSANMSNLSDPTKDLLVTDQIVERTSHLVDRMLQLGAIEHSHEDRFMIPPLKKQKLYKILSKFDGE